MSRELLTQVLKVPIQSSHHPFLKGAAPLFSADHVLSPELPKTHVFPVGDAIKPSHFLSSPSVLAFNLPQNQGLLKLVSFSHQLAQVSDIQLQRPSFR